MAAEWLVAKALPRIERGLVFGLFVGILIGLIVALDVDWSRWLQPLANLLEEFGADRDVSLWRAAPAGGAVIGLGAVILLVLGTSVLIIGLLLYPSWLLITTLLLGPISILSKIAHFVLLSMLLLFMAFIIRRCRKGFKQIRTLLIENEELVEIWSKNPAGALLCLFLSFNGSMPQNYPRFLNYTAKYALLHKVSARSHLKKQSEYTFVHQLLLKYFAGLNAADTYFQKGRDLSDLDHEEAQVACTQAVYLDSKLAYAYQIRGMAYRGLEKPEEARQDFEKAQELLDEEGTFKEKKDENEARSAGIPTQ